MGIRQKAIRRVTQLAVAAGVLGAAAWAVAADNYTEAEVHVIRNMSERQTTFNRFNKLAVEKGSTELIRQVAKKDLEEHEKLFEELKALSIRTGIDDFGTGMGAGGPPQGGAGPAPQQGQPPAGMAGGAPGADGMGGGMAAGPSGYANRYYAELEQLSGAAFDERYLIRALQYHEDMERTLNGELRDGVNPELLAWTKSHIKQYEQHATLIQRILFGEVTSINTDQQLGADMRNDGPGAGAPPSRGTAAAPRAE